MIYVILLLSIKIRTLRRIRTYLIMCSSCICIKGKIRTLRRIRYKNEQRCIKIILMLLKVLICNPKDNQHLNQSLKDKEVLILLKVLIWHQQILSKDLHNNKTRPYSLKSLSSITTRTQIQLRIQNRYPYSP